MLWEKIRNFWDQKFEANTRGFVSIILLALVGVAAFVPILTYFYFAKDLNAQESILNKKDTGVILLDRNNKPFFKFYEAHFKDYTPLSKIPVHFQQAVIAAEDKEFYSHPGFSLKGMVGALLADAKSGDLAYGGSTITQQLVKTSLLNSKKNIFRKYQEVILSQEIERRYSKEQILEMYLNSVYFGEGAFGAEQAAEIYFNKNIADINLAESSILAAVLPAPSKFSPISGDFDEAKKRQEYVLSEMVQQKYITPEEKQKALESKLNFQTKKENFPFVAPHFALQVKQQLIDKYGEERVARSGFRVRTSLDLDFQQYAEKIVTDQVNNLKGNRVTNGAAVVMDPKTGEVIAMVGSKDWSDENFGKVNVATSLRQPGSAFKPIVYAAALNERIITPATILQDEPKSFPEDNDYNSWSYKNGKNLYKPINYDKKFRGPVTVRRALVNSLNVPAVETLSKVGIANAISMSRNLGVSTLDDPSKYGLSLTLGAGEVRLIELAGAYSVFANKGLKNDPTNIIEIRDKNEKAVYKYEAQNVQALDPGVAFQISSILSDNKARAEVFGTALNISRPAAVKTGTTENYKDAWTFGYTPSVVVGVWVGNNDGKPMDQVAGSLGAAPIWRNLMEQYLQGKPVEQFEIPTNVVKVTTCTTTIKPKPTPTPDQKDVKVEDLPAGRQDLKPEVITTTYTEYFIKGTEPISKCKAQESTPQPSSSPEILPTPQIEQTPPPVTSTYTDDVKTTQGFFWQYFGGPSDDIVSPQNTIQPTANPTQAPSPTPLIIINQAEEIGNKKNKFKEN